MTRTVVWVTVGVLAIVSGMCPAKSTAELAQENAQLRGRVEKLERQVGALQSAADSGATGGAPATGKKPLWSNLDVQFYGFIKGDASYDTARTTPGNFVVWVDSEANKRDDDEFNLTANETRLGVAVSGPKNGRIETSGRVEFDFYGGGADENKAAIQMRHAYLQILWPEHRLSILGGQTWDIISPLNAPTLNYTVLWDAGNIGYRRPQIRLTKDFMMEHDTALRVVGGITRTIGQDSAVANVNSESGEDAGFPTFQGRVGLTFPWLAAGPTQAGLSGHWGQEEYDVDAAGTHKEFDTWSVNRDLTQPVNTWMSFKAELFCGENLNTFFGGIGQGVREVKVGNNVVNHANEIASRGGWCAATIQPSGPATFNLGVGIDDVDAGDVNPGDRTLNRTVFGNIIYAVNKHADIGFELSHWRTDYRGPGDADSVRFQTSLKYKF